MYWKDDEKWYNGRIAKYDNSNGKHLIEYDDGDTEWVDIATEKVELLDAWVLKPRTKKKPLGAAAAVANPASKAASKAAAAKRKRAATVIDSDDEEKGSGSEYAMSEDEDEAGASSDDESLDLEESEEESADLEDLDEDLDDVSDEDDESPPKGKSNLKAPAKSGLKKKLPAVTPAEKTKTKASNAGAAPASAARTPGVALNNGVSITPTSGGTSGKKNNNNNATTAVVSVQPRPTVGHTPASATAMRSALDRSPSSGSPGGALADAAAASAQDVTRFAARDAARFPFLHPDKIKDASRRRPSDPDYNPNTLYIPPDWFKQQKISEGQRQWWEFKAAHWGSVLLFKMGKFYELFEMDAHLGAECLGLSYMKGDQPHCGFPEAGYAAMAERLARAGHRVVVIEQTETPDLLAKRNEERKRQGLKKDNVVRREKVAVLTRGTLTDAEMMGAVPDAQYLMAVAEVPLPEEESEKNAMEVDGDQDTAAGGGSRDKVWIGAAAVDVATGQLLVGQWRDDELRSQLRAALTALAPVEVVLPRGGLSGPSRRVVLGVLRCPLVNELPPGSDEGQFWPAEETWHRLLEHHHNTPTITEENGNGSNTSTKGYFPSGELPSVLAKMEADRPAYVAAATALGGCISYLKNALLDRRILGAGRMEAMEEAVGVGNQGQDGSTQDGEENKKISVPAYMNLDGPALENLEIMENSEGGVVGTLLAALDHCTTPFGRRRLRQWLCRPLCRVEDIVARQDAVEDLMGPAEEAAGAARKALSGVSDLERALARLGATGAGLGSMRDDPKVVLYEDVSKKRVQAVVGTLRALEKVQQAVGAFARCGATSSLLLDLVTPGRGRFPDLQPALSEMQGAADWEDAEATGRVVPAPGVDAEYDAAEAAVKAAENALAEHLKELKAELGSREVRYASLNKESHVIEVPEVSKSSNFGDFYCQVVFYLWSCGFIEIFP